jgi:hypothetical protein
MLTETPELQAPWGVSRYLDGSWGIFIWFPDGGWAFYSSKNRKFFSQYAGLSSPHYCWQEFCDWITAPDNWKLVRQVVGASQRPVRLEDQMEFDY